MLKNEALFVRRVSARVVLYGPFRTARAARRRLSRADEVQISIFGSKTLTKRAFLRAFSLLQIARPVFGQ